MAKKQSKRKGSILSSMNKDEDTTEQKLIKKEEQIEKSILDKIHKYFHTHLDNYASSHGRRIEGALFFFNFVLKIVRIKLNFHCNRSERVIYIKIL